MQNETPQQADVLLVTVTDVETRAVLDEFQAQLQRPSVRRFVDVNTYYYLGSVDGAEVYLVRTEMGSGGVGGSALTVSDSIRDLKPSAIIMIGIAFGIDPAKQAIGEILVARQLIDYELQRVGSGPNGQAVVRLRGDRPSASPRLLSRFRDGALDWQHSGVDFGLILSGAKLVDQEDFRKQLQALEPEAIGGEMEGAGMYAIAQRTKVDWILVKAICDYADGNKGVDKKSRQHVAATNAAQFVFHVLRLGGFQQQRQQPQPQQQPIAQAHTQQATNPGPTQTPQGIATTLRELLIAHFSDGELNDLCFDLGIDYESLPGHGKSAKARELVLYAQRRGMLAKLIHRCREVRPEVNWPKID